MLGHAKVAEQKYSGTKIRGVDTRRSQLASTSSGVSIGSASQPPRMLCGALIFVGLSHDLSLSVLTSYSCLKPYPSAVFIWLMCCRRSATLTAGCSWPVWYGELFLRP